VRYQTKEVYFEGNDLHVITVEDKHLVFTNAQLTGVEYDRSPGLVEVTPVKFQAVPVMHGDSDDQDMSWKGTVEANEKKARKRKRT